MSTLADGQLAATATSLVGAPPSNRVDVVLSNTSGNEETVQLTFSRQGGTSRNLPTIVLGGSQSAIVRGVPMTRGDTLYGQTTTASTVDYIVSESGARTFSVDVLDERGSMGASTLRKMLRGIEVLAEGEQFDPG